MTDEDIKDAHAQGFIEGCNHLEAELREARFDIEVLKAQLFALTHHSESAVKISKLAERCKRLDRQLALAQIVFDEIDGHGTMVPTAIRIALEAWRKEVKE